MTRHSLSKFLLTTGPVYNKWHETELERWLSDHSIPYPTPADRKDLENLVKTNWNSKVAQPYNGWSTPQLQTYLKSKGADAKIASANNKDTLLKQVKGYWTESADSASNAYGSVKHWIFDRYVTPTSLGGSSTNFNGVAGPILS